MSHISTVGIPNFAGKVHEPRAPLESKQERIKCIALNTLGAITLGAGIALIGLTATAILGPFGAMLAIGCIALSFYIFTEANDQEPSPVPYPETPKVSPKKEEDPKKLLANQLKKEISEKKRELKHLHQLKSEIQQRPSPFYSADCLEEIILKAKSDYEALLEEYRLL